MKRYNVIFTQNWAYTVEAENEDEAESLAFKEFQSEMRRSAGSTCYDDIETQCLDPDEDDDEDEWAPLKTPFWQSARSFTPTFAYKNLEIHTVFLRFLTLNLSQNFWAPAQN